MSLSDKVARIKGDISKTVGTVCRERFWIDCYGAYEIHPRHLVFWICVDSDREKTKLAGNVELMNSLRNILVVHEYPTEGRSFVHIGFESEETVARESGGNWYYHFK